VVRISQHASCDVDDQAQALEGWKQSYEQLGRGRFSGQTRQLLMDDGMLLRESTNLPLREEIAPPPDHWVFAMPEVMHPDTRFAGRTLQGSSLIPLLPGQEYELLATGTLDLVAVSVHRRVVESLDVALQDWLYTLRGACTVALLPRAAAAALSLLQQAVAQAEAFACNAAGADQCQLLTAVVSGLVCLGAKSSKAASLDAVPRRAQARQQVVRRAVEFMHAHLQQDIRAADICAAAYASQRTLQYCFEECLRVTPLAYLRALRLNQARRMLKSRFAPSITEVAGLMGFSSSSHFTQHYRAMFGELPSSTLRLSVGRHFPTGPAAPSC
jgi:AraC family ethanolamine operon transcriptional activator